MLLFTAMLALCATYGERLYFSDQAAMTAGAVTAGNLDGGGIWYNPATLAGHGDNHLDVSGSTYALRIRHVDRAFALRSAGQDAALGFSSVDVTSVPNVLTIIRKLNEDLNIGFAVLITEHDLRSASARSTALIGGQTLSQRFDIQQEHTVYHAGVALSWNYAPTLRLGASLYASLDRTSLSSQYSADLRTPDQFFALFGDRESAWRVGFEGMVGVDWKPHEQWALAATLRSPRFAIVAQNQATLTQASGGAGTAVFNAADLTLPGGEPWIRTPLRLTVGTRFSFATGSHIALDVEGFLPITDQEPLAAPAIGVRLGGKWQMFETFALGIGGFARSPEVSASNGFGADKLSTVGGTMGAEYRTVLELKDRPDPIILSLTVAIRYAADFGAAGTSTLDLGTNTLVASQTPVVFHELVPYVGSSVSF